MLNHFDAYYDRLQEPNKSCILALRSFFLQYDENIHEVWKYGGPFCYVWKDKLTHEPYIGITKGYLIEHEILVKGNRTRIKIIPIATDKDIPIKEIGEVFELVLQHYI